MSGFEIAGLVIGTLPFCGLVLKTLESSRGKISRFKHCNEEIQELEDKVSKVWDGIRASFESIYGLAGLPFPHWNPPYADNLKAILQDSSPIHTALTPQCYQTFETIKQTAAEIRSLVERLCRKHGLAPEEDSHDIEKPWPYGLDSCRRFKRRVRFALARDTIDEKLGKINALRVTLYEQVILLLANQ